MARLAKEYHGLMQNPIEGIDLYPLDESNLYEWVAFIRGPLETPYEQGVFELRLSVPTSYPSQPPKVKFVTRCFHPNVHFQTGEICLDLLKDAWSAVYTLQ